MCALIFTDIDVWYPSSIQTCDKIEWLLTNFYEKLVRGHWLLVVALKLKVVEFAT